MILHLLVRLLVFLGLPFLMNLVFFFIHFTLTTTTISVAPAMTDPQVRLASNENSSSELM